MNILWATIGGAVGGVLGFWLATLVSRWVPEKWRRGIVSAVPIAIAVVCGRVAVSVYEYQTSAPASIELELLASQEVGPLIRAWKESDPSSYQTFISKLSSGVRGGQDFPTLVSTVRAQVAEVVTHRMPFLDDVQAVESIRLGRMELEQLSPKHPELCKPVFAGGSFGDIAPYLTDDLEARERAMYLAALRADTSARQRVLAGQAFESAIGNLLAAVRSKVGNDVSLIATGADIAGREKRYCQVAIKVFEEMEALPTVEAASFIRGMAAAN